ncbi:MAG: hypothetical protein ACYC6Y_23670 [Thermoguttaceae bacterium]
MEMLLAGNDPTLSILRDQYAASTVAKREFTGVGFFVTFAIPSQVERLGDRKSLHFGDVQAEIEGMQYGAGFVIHVSDGVLEYLEGYSYDEPWPASVQHFQLSYTGGKQRDLMVLWGQSATDAGVRTRPSQ